MLTRFTILIFLTTISSFAYSQKLSFGIKGGVNYSNQIWINHQFIHPTLGLTGEDSRTRGDNKLGIKLGAFADIALNDFLSFSPGLLYNQKGLAMKYGFYDPNRSPPFYSKSNKVTLNYISFDAPLKFSLKKEPWLPYLLVGARIDGLLGYHQSLSKADFELRGPGEEGYRYFYEELHKGNIGLLTAIGMEKNVSTKLNVFLELEYNPDLGKAANKPWRTIKNSMFALNAGIRWKKN